MQRARSAKVAGGAALCLALALTARLPAQSPTQMPVPTEVPASSIPSMPAPDRGALPQPSAAPARQQPSPTAASPTPTPTPAPRVDQTRSPRPAPADVPARDLPVPGTLPAFAGYAAYDPNLPAIFAAYSGTYIPVDSPIYAMALRLYGLGYLDTAFLNMRPWTRQSLLHMLRATAPTVTGSGDDEAIALLARMNTLLAAELARDPATTVYGLDTLYVRALGIGGQTLRDSYHLGQTLQNDYGRPYEPGLNAVAGLSSITERGRFSLYVRGEYEHAPAAAGYSQALSAQLSTLDEIPFSGANLNQATIPTGPIAAANPFRLLEATLSAHLLGHEISAGKSDAWEGPGFGSAMGWSNNAEDIYTFRINRVEPLRIPLLSSLLGPARYDFFVGSLKGHTYPNSPYIHSEMFSFAPTANFQFGFERSVIWGGAGHEPVTLHTFLQSFFSFSDTTDAEKSSAKDPGARFSVFNFSWRLPYARHWLTLYADSISHDDVSPISAPRRAAYRPGLYLARFPRLPKLDLRVEAANTDFSTLAAQHGQGDYFEIVQRQGYTNKGFILGDAIGRQAKGGQTWLTWHLSADEWLQLSYLNKKIPNGFVPGGTTQNQFTFDVRKRLRPALDLDAWVQVEGWQAPIYEPGAHRDTAAAVQLTWHPTLRQRHEASRSPSTQVPIGVHSP